jgi:hypothetical protein
MIQAAGVASDFAWTWLRFESDSGRVREMVLLDGVRIETGAEELFKAARRTAFAVVRRVGDELSLETDAGVDFTVASLGAGRATVNGQAAAFGVDSVLRFAGGRPYAGAAAGRATAETLR